MHETNCTADLRHSVLCPPTRREARTRASCAAITNLHCYSICSFVDVSVALSCGVQVCVLAGRAPGPCHPSSLCRALDLSGTSTPSGHLLQTSLEPCKCSTAHRWGSGNWQGVRPRHNCSHSDKCVCPVRPRQSYPQEARSCMNPTSSTPCPPRCVHGTSTGFTACPICICRRPQRISRHHPALGAQCHCLQFPYLPSWTSRRLV